VKSVSLAVLVIIGFIIGWGLFNYLLVSSGFVLAGLEKQFPTLQPFLGITFVALLIVLLFISYSKTAARAKQSMGEHGLSKLVDIYLSFRWGQIFLVDLIILLTIALLLMTNL